MTESQHLPRRIAELARTIPQDTARLADLVEAERAANARVVEAERVLSVARAEAEQAKRERTGLERDIEAVRALLEYGRERYGFDTAALLQPAPATPSQGMPAVRVADPVGLGGGYRCRTEGCGGELTHQDGVWVHARSGRPECPPEDPSEGAPDPAVVALLERGAAVASGGGGGGRAE